MRRRIESQRGTVLMVAMILVLLLAGLTMAYVAITGRQAASAYVSYKSDRALYLAEAGLADAMFDFENGGSGYLNPQSGMCGGTYQTTAVPIGTTFVVITSNGAFVDTDRTVQIVAYDGTHPIFNHAIFAGDESDDPEYALGFGGVDDGANQRWQDEVYGDVYSGEDIVVEDDAEMNGDLRAEGDIIGATGTRDTLPIPDIAGMDYPNNHDVNVNQEFDQFGYSIGVSGYGTGLAVPEENAAHVFHKNPSDRQTECGMTPGDDFFLEDVYEHCQSYNTRISVAPTGNDQVYFVDGDLWIHNKNTYGFQLKNPDSHITIVVQGSIHFADDFHYHNDVKSGVAFIAIKGPNDPDGEYSGNIYIGDPVFGTVQEINAFLYAENNFIDENLDEGGSAEFCINGIMTAGNHVSINRDFAGSGYWTGAYPNRRWVPTSEEGTYHSKMIVKLDDRIFTGQLLLPGLPRIDPGEGNWLILAWYERKPEAQ